MPNEIQNHHSPARLADDPSTGCPRRRPGRERRAQARAFTLVEVLIVVVILGVLASIVVPAFGGTTDEARKGAFITELKIFADAAEYASAVNGGDIADSSTGDVPPELEPYINTDGWLDGTPIGGQWDIEAGENGITLAIGVHFQGDNPGDDFMQDIDARFDNGDLESGAFQRLDDNNRFYWVIIP
jgi:prepilin-type N-terminal cleavage/methylation domain-containing protein